MAKERSGENKAGGAFAGADAGDGQMDSTTAANGHLDFRQFFAIPATEWKMNEREKYYKTRNPFMLLVDAYDKNYCNK
jgi:hypothetical protein